ncbi:MAG: dockerin type I domain-containing protein [Planctomycetes bacterium]|nr:dockerin type I domain-containing protein [Planctomycetota bacterium]
MTENNRQFDDMDRQVSDRLRQDLRGLFEPPGAVPTRVDKIILNQAKKRLAQPHRLIIRLRWAAGITAAAAAVTIGVILLNPPSVIMSPPALTGGRNPQSTSPVLAEGRADVDANGRVDILDAFQLARSIEARGPVAPQWDLNGDGRIDKDDVNLVALAAVRLDKGA